MYRVLPYTQKSLEVVVTASVWLCLTHSTIIRNGHLDGCFFTLNQDGQEQESKQWEFCSNATADVMANIGWNITSKQTWEIFHCFTKCRLVQSNIFTSENNEYNSKRVRSFYTMNSNATIGQVAKLGNIFDECYNFAEQKISTLKKNGSDVSTCKLFGFFEPCVIKEYSFVAYRKPNGTREQNC